VEDITAIFAQFREPVPATIPISFAAQVKAELGGLASSRACCQIRELQGIFCSTGGHVRDRDSASQACFSGLRGPLARRVVRLSHLLGCGVEYRTARAARQFLFAVEVVLTDELRGVLTGPVALAAERCDRRALLRGLFLGRGSVNPPSSRYHLELGTPAPEWAAVVVEILAGEGIRAGTTRRSGRALVYVKDGDGVVRTLSMLGASQAVMTFESSRVMREVNALVNRQLNFETANLDKTAGSASRQRAAIARLAEAGRLEELPPALRESAQVRLAYPEASLSELAARLRLSKSGINHRLRRLQVATQLLLNRGR
jgi:cell division protein WhiA